MKKIFSVLVLSGLCFYTFWVLFYTEEGLSLRMSSLNESSSNNHLRTSVVEISKNPEQKIVEINSRRVKLVGKVFTDDLRMPASVSKSKIIPFIINRTTGEEAVLFVEEDGSFFTDYLYLIYIVTS